MHNLYSALEFLDGSGCHLISQGTSSRGKCRQDSNLRLSAVYLSQSMGAVLRENQECLSICMHKIFVVWMCRLGADNELYFLGE